MNKVVIKVSEEFTEYPGLRHCVTSDHSGEQFYHEVLNPHFAKTIIDNNVLEVNLDHTAGYAPSFVDEAFGNLVYDFTLALVKKNLVVISQQEPEWIEMLENETYPQWEERRLKGESPKHTSKHDDWYGMTVNKVIEKKKWY